MKIDNLGNIHSFEFDENSGVTEVKKTGILRAFELSDNKFYSDIAKRGKNAWDDILFSNYYD